MKLQQPPGIDRTFGEIAVCSDQGLDGVKGYREVSAYSMVSPEFAWVDDWKRRSGIQKRSRWK
jgi:hypothetical protein